MEQAKILLTDLNDFKNEVIQLNRNFVFIFDLFLQKKEEFEEENEQLKLEDNAFFLELKNESESLKNKIEESFVNPVFDNFFDVYKDLKSSFEFIESDLEFIISSLKLNLTKDVLIFNWAKLESIKITLKLMVENIDKIIENVQKLNN